MTKILWFDDDEDSGWIVSLWLNEDFKVLNENILIGVNDENCNR